MVTKWRDAPLSEYQIHNMSPIAEGDYKYYLLIHATGSAIMMREKTDGTGVLYANAGRGDDGWAGRVGLDYVTYDELA